MLKSKEMMVRAKIRKEVEGIPVYDLQNKLARAQARQKYLWNHGTDDQFIEFEENAIRIEEIAGRFRRSLGRMSYKSR